MAAILLSVSFSVAFNLSDAQEETASAKKAFILDCFD